jgi:hypothetical protein
MITGELPAVTFVKNLLNPSTIVGSFVVCVCAYGEAFTGLYVALAILVFFISSQIFDDVDVLRPWGGFRPTESCSSSGLRRNFPIILRAG